MGDRVSSAAKAVSLSPMEQHWSQQRARGLFLLVCEQWSHAGEIKPISDVLAHEMNLLTILEQWIYLCNDE